MGGRCSFWSVLPLKTEHLLVVEAECKVIVAQFLDGIAIDSRNALCETRCEMWEITVFFCGL